MTGADVEQYGTAHWAGGAASECGAFADVSLVPALDHLPAIETNRASPDVTRGAWQQESKHRREASDCSLSLPTPPTQAAAGECAELLPECDSSVAQEHTPGLEQLPGGF